MHQIDFGAYSAPPDLQLDLRGLLLREGRRGRMEGKGKGGEKEGREGRGGGA